ncbi:MAG: epoxyqueuosine reductase QueH [Lachnospiraceae bacterium]|nr:epoxyqueuosine reductase QueH [Lachnospiraceae bacterium]
MEPKHNYQKDLDKILEELDKDYERQMRETGTIVPRRLLMHSCCGPCSSYCMEYLRQYFAITILYYNPNITEEEEYQKRMAEELRLIEALNKLPQGVREPVDRVFPIGFLQSDYNPADFLAVAKGYESCPEGGERCMRCFELRLRVSARAAKRGDYDYFTTTLTISPLKNAEALNRIGQKVAEAEGTTFLPSDFKKKGGYQRSIELSAEYGLYRQDYCGCAFSKAEAMERRKEQTAREEI